jgi:hypothetical protein
MGFRVWEIFYMNTPYLLICVEKPKEERNPLSAKRGPEWPRWFSFVEELENLNLPTSSIQRLSENTFLIPLNQFASVAARVLALPALQAIPFQVFYLESAPQPCS